MRVCVCAHILLLYLFLISIIHQNTRGDKRTFCQTHWQHINEAFFFLLRNFAVAFPILHVFVLPSPPTTHKTWVHQVIPFLFVLFLFLFFLFGGCLYESCEIYSDFLHFPLGTLFALAVACVLCTAVGESPLWEHGTDAYSYHLSSCSMPE